MSAERWDRAQKLFLAAADLAPPERQCLLDEACQGDPGLRAEVESLIRADRGSTEFLASLVRREATRLLGRREA
jgi:hypothetical protein